jgi:hypothetical protein
MKVESGQNRKKKSIRSKICLESQKWVVKAADHTYIGPYTCREYTPGEIFQCLEVSVSQADFDVALNFFFSDVTSRRQKVVTSSSISRHFLSSS